MADIRSAIQYSCIIFGLFIRSRIVDVINLPYVKSNRSAPHGSSNGSSIPCLKTLVNVPKEHHQTPISSQLVSENFHYEDLLIFHSFLLTPATVLPNILDIV